MPVGYIVIHTVSRDGMEGSDQPLAFEAETWTMMGSPYARLKGAVERTL